MNSARSIATVFLVLLLSAVAGRAAVAQRGVDYQATPAVPGAARMQTLSLHPEEINVLAANLAGVSPGLKSKVLNHMFHDVYAKRPDWFRDAGYGLMFQWCNRTTPPKGDIKPWEQKVADFDLDGFMKLVEDSAPPSCCGP